LGGWPGEANFFSWWTRTSTSTYLRQRDASTERRTMGMFASTGEQEKALEKQG
jgi:hypothetical protein